MENIKQSGLPLRPVYYKYYRVYKNDTSIMQIPVNNFKHIVGIKKVPAALILQSNAVTYNQYSDIGQAMEKAKAGAQAYIAQLIKRGAEGLPELLQYRIDHYEDLNVNLLDANICREESEMNAHKDFEYKPYRIHLS